MDEIERLKEIEQAKETLKKHAKESCHVCYGRGFVGFNTVTDKFIVFKSKGCAYYSMRREYLEAHREFLRKQQEEKKNKEADNEQSE